MTPTSPEVAQALGQDLETVRRRAEELSEANPMLGHRGCRLGISFPEIYEMQARAIFEGAIKVAEETGAAPVPEIMIPLVGVKRELDITRAQIDKVAAEVFAKAGRTIEYIVGTMIELPRAALIADKIAEAADFFSFGTNDLTQTTFGLSRDDAGKFLPHYVEAGILPKDPFVSLDIDGVGVLVRMAAEKGRKTKNGLKLGICGEHGGRSGVDRVLRGGRVGLCVVQPVSGTCRQAGSRAGGAGRRNRQNSLEGQGALPPGPPLRAEPLEPFTLGGLLPCAPDIRRTRQPPPESHGFKRPLAFCGSRAEPGLPTTRSPASRSR